MKRWLLFIAILLLISPNLVFAASPKAKHIKVDTDNLDGNLSNADDTVQKALETIDDGEFGVLDATYITQTPNASLTNEQAINGLSDGILKHTSGVLSQATAGTDYFNSDSQIDHDSLTNFTANEHIDWTNSTDNFLTSGSVNVGADLVIETTSTPASASDTGTTGTIEWDSSYIYVCVATDTWKRAALSTWGVAGYLLLDDGVSYILLDDGTSKIVIQ